MDSAPTKQLKAQTGWIVFAFCWIVSLLGVWVLRQAFIPREELSCYANACTLNHAVQAWNKAHADHVMDDKVEIDQAALLSGGFLKKPLNYDPQKHYYFVDRQVHGLKVKCNKHEDNPTVLKLTGVTLLAVLLFVVWCSFKNYVFWKDGA
jgi:hypothetical protein